MTARPDILEHPRGFAAIQSDGIAREGVRWTRHALNDNLFKYHAACFGTHGTLEAIGALRRQGLRPEAVRSIVLKVDAGADAMCNIAEPRTGLEAKFSLRFNAALALHGADTADVTTYDDAVTLRADLEAVRRLTTVTFAPSDWPEDITEVTVETFDGRIWAQKHDVSFAPGDLVSQGRRLRAKFLGLAEPVIEQAGAARLLAAIDQIEALNDIGQLLRLAICDEKRSAA